MLKLSTAYGKHYKIHDNGDIERLDIPGFETSGQWKLLGIEHVKRNYFIPLDKLLTGHIPANLLYKNGHPQYTVRDLDHGTARVWGNTIYHGIKHLSVV